MEWQKSYCEVGKQNYVLETSKPRTIFYNNAISQNSYPLFGLNIKINQMD